MNDRLHAGMREASRLTRAGRLIDATALLQRVLQSGRGQDSNASSAGVPSTIDLAPEAIEETSAAHSRPERTLRARLPDVLHRLLDRGTPSWFAPGRGGSSSTRRTSALTSGLGCLIVSLWVGVMIWAPGGLSSSTCPV